MCISFLADYEMSVCLSAPARKYPESPSIRGCHCFARNRGMNKNFEIPRKIANDPRNVAVNLSRSWQFCNSLVLFLVSQSVVPRDMEKLF